MRRSRLCCLAILLASVAISSSAHAFRRYGYLHGSQCQASDPRTEFVSYTNNGVKVSEQADPRKTVSLACPIPWEQDDLLPWAQKVQQIVVSVYWSCDASSAAVSGTAPFDPSCMVYAMGPNDSTIYIPLTTIVNPDTPEPVYIFEYDGEIPFGAIFSTMLYCNDVAQDVGIMSYTIDTCFADSGATCGL